MNQERLVTEDRHSGTTLYTEANQYLREVFILQLQERFSKEAREQGSAFLPVVEADLNRVFALRFDSIFANDNAVRIDNWMLEFTNYLSMEPDILKS